MSCLPVYKRRVLEHIMLATPRRTARASTRRAFRGVGEMEVSNRSNSSARLTEDQSRLIPLLCAERLGFLGDVLNEAQRVTFHAEAESIAGGREVEVTKGSG